MEVVDYDPACEWDAYVRNKERTWECRLDEARCLDCKNCYAYHLDSTIGFCIENMVFIDPNDSIREYGLEDCFSED